MGKDDPADILARWRNPRIKRQEEPIELVLRVLEYKGFETRRGSRGHYVAVHPALAGAPFGMRVLTTSAHAHGQPGIVPKTAINKIVEAIEVIEATQQGKDEQY